MKRLFQVVNHRGKMVPGQFFDKKSKAKKLRNALNKEAKKGVSFHVSIGPDHWRAS